MKEAFYVVMNITLLAMCSFVGVIAMFIYQ